MQQYKVINDIIKGARPGETVNLTEDEARAYGPDYVELIGEISEPKTLTKKELAELIQKITGQKAKGSNLEDLKAEYAEAMAKTQANEGGQKQSEGSQDDAGTDGKGLEEPNANKAITNAQNKGL